MAQAITNHGSGTLGAPSEAAARVTPALLAGGMVAGPLFIVASLVQALTRPGFDLRRHPISMLSLGDLGWIQAANFVVSGVLVIACAVGIRLALRPGRGRAWGPLLFGGYGLGLVAAGFFSADPALGFPPGVPESSTWSLHAVVHTIAFFTSFVSLIAACFVLARRFSGLRRRGWAIYCAATGLCPFGLIGLSTATGGSGVPLFVMGVITSAWVMVLPARLLAERAGGRE